jgi:hypothetical protein
MERRDPLDDYLDSLTAAMAAARAHPQTEAPPYADDGLDALLAEQADAINSAARPQDVRGGSDSE